MDAIKLLSRLANEVSEKEVREEDVVVETETSFYFMEFVFKGVKYQYADAPLLVKDYIRKFADDVYADSEINVDNWTLCDGWCISSNGRFVGVYPTEKEILTDEELLCRMDSVLAELDSEYTDGCREFYYTLMELGTIVIDEKKYDSWLASRVPKDELVKRLDDATHGTIKVYTNVEVEKVLGALLAEGTITPDTDGETLTNEFVDYLLEGVTFDGVYIRSCRRCSVCGAIMVEGYCYDDGVAYFCSDDCRRNYGISDE